MSVSILTPSYNYGRFIDDAIASVTAQGGDIEHVIVDGASNDDTVQRLKQISDPRVRWSSEPDAGMSDALNKALSRSSGEWIGLVNADEFLLPRAIESVLALAARYPEADVIYGDAVFVNAVGEFDRLFCLYPVSRNVVRWYGCTLLSCSVFIRRAALGSRGWDVELVRNNDWDMWLQLIANGSRFRHLPQSLSAYRVHESRLTEGHMPLVSDEPQRVRRRYGIPTNPTVVPPLHAIGRVDHAIHKLIHGCYAKQRRVDPLLRGADMRWFESDIARRNAETLLRAESGSSR